MITRKNYGRLFLATALGLTIAACGENKTETDSETEAAVEETAAVADIANEITETEAPDAMTGPDAYALDNIAFLENNETAEGVSVTATGLQYKLIDAGSGDGAKPKAEDFVTVHYAGRLIDGTEFDSSIRRGEPATFPLNRVIPGWTEGLQLMSVGQKMQFTIPAELAYGDQSDPRSPIPANSTLVFDVELLDIKTAEEMIAEQERQLAEFRAPQEAYLEENAKKEGITVTESGLQYKVLESGSGATPSIDSTVEVHYEGRLIDGEVFDSSYRRGETIEFPVTGVIAGWTEALQLMKEGDKWQITLPHDIAYGPRGTGGSIPPYATLVFDVELIAVK
jgi:peptidylprolyl isomerase